ncbi:MAG TPA: stage V sporulation protein AC [Firmicutes bacterium]|jgi:stage V sporulation protein AC|nr:stage V sporulation protein AC [Bacillota bacterium]
MVAKKEEKDIKRQQALEQEYKNLAQRQKPRTPVLRNVLVAYLVGGLICVIGQAITQLYIRLGYSIEDVGSPTVATLILISAVLTGLGIYDVIGQFAGAGSAVPVTGFANSVVSAALEFKREGLVLGVGARMFSLAGPVIVYGTVTAFLVGIIKALLR